MKRRVSGLEVLGAGVVAAAVIACGEAGIEHGGELMEDAGTWMLDAGISMADAGMHPRGRDADTPSERDAGGALEDAGRMMMQMGGDMLADAGEMLRDAGVQLDGSAPDVMHDGAVAQTACGTCTAGMRQMVVTADQDLQQLRGSTLEGAGWTTARSAPVAPGSGNGCSVEAELRQLSAKLADGPLVLTDVYYASSVAGQLFTVPVGSPCYEPGPVSFAAITCNTSSTVFAPAPVRPAASRSVFATQDGFALTGARVVIAANETLCAIGGPLSAARTTDPVAPTTTRLLWSGFAPYE